MSASKYATNFILELRYVEFLLNQLSRLRAAQKVNCQKCAELRDRISTLESELRKPQANNRDYDNDISKILRQENIELEREIGKIKGELERTLHFLRVAESHANGQRAKIRSLEEELRLARDDTNLDFKRKVEIQKDLERMKQENAQLKTHNLQQWNNALVEKQRAAKAEMECDFKGDKIRTLAITLANKQRKFQDELSDMRKQLRHQTRRADAQREARVRLEVENEELRRPRTGLRRVRQVFYT
ncbi:hypothetical protein F5Y12DRAFT_792332 [Xylaria sp. FL1777]|nr:hypothetical protein F5Y12DRAFT_792332 [Xylaria sp. FL1777]